MSKVSGTSASALSSLFPSCSSRFDPTKGVQKKAPKKKSKPSSLTITAVTEPWRGVPKGKYKGTISDKRCIKKIQVYRAMTATEVKNSILEAFEHVPMSKYCILASNRKGALFRDRNQSPTGADLCDGVIRRKAILYICDEVSSTIRSNCTLYSLYIQCRVKLILNQTVLTAYLKFL